MYSKRLVFVAACLGMIVFGIMMTTLGSILPDIMDRYGMAKSSAGTLFTLLSIGVMIGSLGFGPIVDRYGYKGVLAFCTLIVMIGMQGIAYSPSVDWLRASILFIGVGGGVLNGGTNALVADVSVEGRSAGLSLLGVFFGVGALGIPLTLGILLDFFSYSAIISVIGAAVIVPLAFIAFIRFPAPKQQRGFPIREGLGLTKESTLLLFGFILFVQSGMEITVGGWTVAYFHEVVGFEASDAVFFLSLFWAGLMIARLIMGGLLRRISPSSALQISIGIAFAAVLVLLLSEGRTSAAIAIFFIGAGFAACFPIVLGYVGDLYPRLSGTAFSIVFAISLIGGSLFPYVAGIIGEHYGLRAAFSAIPAGLVVVFLVFRLLVRRIAQERPTSAAVR